MKKIIVINGTGGSGKDTFVNYVSKYAKVYNFSSVDKVKKIARQVGWSGQKTEKDRKFLSDLKQLTTAYNDMSFNSIKDAVKHFEELDEEIMFIHIREPHEIARAVEYFQAESLLLKRVGHKIIDSNVSDANVENYDYDYQILNDTLEGLDESAKKFVQNIKDKNAFQKVKK